MYVARPGIEPRTPDLRVRCPTDCATRPGSANAAVRQNGADEMANCVDPHQTASICSQASRL